MIKAMEILGRISMLSGKIPIKIEKGKFIERWRRKAKGTKVR